MTNIHCKYDELLDPKKLKEHPKNRNKHDKEQIKRLADLFGYHGIRHPIIVSRRSGFIVAGHGRRSAAIAGGIKQYPVVYQDFQTDEAEYAFIQADNAIALWAELDLAGINQDIIDLGPDFNLEMLGIKDFVLEPAEKFEAQCDDDEIPEHVEPKAKLGDIYKLGNHRLMCGDSTSIDAVDKLMGGEKADMVLSDPPYGMKLDTDWSDMKGSMGDSAHGTSGKKYKPVAGDGDDFVPELIQTFFAAFNCAEMFLFGADYFAELLPDKNKGSWLVWDKRKDTQAEAFGSEFELIWSKSKHKRRMLRHDWFGFLSSANTKEARNRVHPTQKPTSLLVDIIEQWGKAGDHVADLYGGSGSTLIACEKTGRSCFMMELDPHYIDVIVARWEKYTGKKAELLNG
jgi:DNA modification methylase